MKTWGELPSLSRHNGCEEFDEAEKNNVFEGLVRRYCSRSLADKSQQRTLWSYVFLIQTGLLASWPPWSGSDSYRLNNWTTEQLPLIICIAVVPRAAEILLLLLIANRFVIKTEIVFSEMVEWQVIHASCRSSRPEVGSDKVACEDHTWCCCLSRDCQSRWFREVSNSCLLVLVPPAPSLLEHLDIWS